MKQDELYDEDQDFVESFLEATKSIGRAQVKERFRKLDQKGQVKKLRFYWVAAAIALFIIASVFIMKPSQTDQLYAEYYHKMSNKVVMITRGETGIDSLKMAFSAYDSNNYKVASDLFKELEANNPEVKVYQGLIALEEAEFLKAIEIFEPLINSEDYQFNNEAKWYAALTYLKLKEKEKARPILKELSSGTSAYHLKALAILSEI